MASNQVARTLALWAVVALVALGLVAGAEAEGGNKPVIN